VQLVQHPHGLVRAVRLDEVARGLREEHDAADDQETGDALEREWEPPRERVRVGDFGRAVADPCGNDETHADHLLGDANY
jgi:hypothetical protein